MCVWVCVFVCVSVLHIKRKAPSRLLAKQGLQSCHCSCRRLGLVSVASQVKPSQPRPSSVCVCVQMMIRIMIIEMLIMTMLRPNFHMRQPSLFGLTSQTWEKFACQVGITASQTNESWPKTTYGHTHTHSHQHAHKYTLQHTYSLGMAYCKSQVTAPAGRDGETNAPTLPLAVSGKTDKTWPPQLEASLTLPCHAPAPPASFRPAANNIE